MAIQVHLEEVLKKRGMTSKELCARVGITEANLSILRSGKAKGVRFGTINKICYYLQCDVGDILSFGFKNKITNEDTEIWRKKMKNKSIILGFAGVLLICFIYGAMGTVTLANAEAGEADTESKDRLIGIFVTTDYLDLFDFEGYLNDNINKVMDGTVNVRREDSARQIVCRIGRQNVDRYRNRQNQHHERICF